MGKNKEERVPFTITIPKSLNKKVRVTAAERGIMLGHLTEEALECWFIHDAISQQMSR